jgi:hypothetical protein
MSLFSINFSGQHRVLVGFLGAAFILLLPFSARGYIEKGGNIGRDEIWGPENGPYVIEGPVIVEKGVTLTNDGSWD